MASLNQIAAGIEKAERKGNLSAAKELRAIYNREYARLHPVPKQEEDAGFFENITSGLGAGYVGTLESAALGAATLQEEEAELKSRQKIKSIADRFTPEGGDKDSISYKLASGIGSIGAFATAAPLGKAALPIAGVLGVASGAGEASERARAYGATEEERNVAVRKGAAIGATEVLPLGLLAKSLKIPGLPKALDKISSKVSPATVTGIKSRLQRAAATGVKEGAQEAAAAVLQNLTEQGYNPEQVLFEAGVIEEGSIGGGAGAILQGLVDLFGGKKRIRSVTDDEGTAEETTAETPVSAETTATEETKEETKEEPTTAEETISVFDAKGTKYKARVVERSEAGSVIVVDNEGNQVVLDQSPTAVSADVNDPDYKILSPGHGQKGKILSKINDLDALETTIKGKLKDPKTVGMVRQDFIMDLNAIKAERKRRTEETAEPATPVEKKKEPKPRAGVETKVSAFLNQLDVDKLEQRLGNAEQEAKNAGLATGTYELMVRSAINKKKETTDVGEQTARTPDAETTGDSVPSSPEVVGQQRTKGAGKPARPVKGGLDDSVSDTGRPARRKGRKQPALKDPTARLGLKPGQKINLAKLQREETAQIKTKPPAVVEGADAPINSESAPVRNKRTNKIRYAGSTRFVSNHPAYSRDLKRLNDLYNTPIVKEVSKKAKTEAEKTRLTEQNQVVEYFNKFDSPMDAIMDATRSVSGKGIVIAKTKQDAELQAPTNPDKQAQDLEFRKIDEILKGTEGENARAVIRWANKNLSKETKKQIRERTNQFKKEFAGAVTALTKFNQAQRKAKRLAEKKEAERKAAEAVEAAKTPKEVKEDKKDKEQKKTAAVKSLAKELKEETKLSKADRAKASADANFDKFVSNPKTDLSKPNDFQKARGYAEAGTNPEEQIDRLNVELARAVTDARKVRQATENVGEKSEDLGQTPTAKPNKLKVAVDKAKERLNDDKVTTQGLVLLSRDQNVKYLNKATIEEAITYSKRAAEAQRQGYNKLYQNDGVTNNQLSEEISGGVMKALKENDIKGALLAARAQIKNPKLRSIANALIENMGTTQIMFLDNTRMDEFLGPVNEGAYNEGVFEPISNIIYLNEDFPVTVHTLLHESTHAATYVYMKTNPKDKVVKELESLYEQVLEIGVLDKQYAKIDVYEFVAEVFSNPEMRGILSRMRVEKDGTVRQASLYEKFVAIIKNFFNRFRDDSLEDVNSALTKADKAIREVLAPSPNVWDGVTELEPKLMAKGIDEALRPIREEVKSTSSFKDWWKNLTAGKAGLKGLAMGVHLHTLGDLARSAGFGNLVTELHEVINNQAGNMSKAVEKVDKAIAEKKERAKRLSPKAVQAFEDLIYHMEYGATLYDVNPFAGTLEYKGKFDNDGNDLYEIYGKQQDVLDGLRDTEVKELRAQYEIEKRLNKSQFEGVIKALQKESRKVAESGDANASKQLEGIITTLLSRATIEEYWPLTRQEGKFAASYIYEVVDEKTGAIIREEPGFEIFKNVSERDAFIDKLKDLPNAKKVKPILMDDKFSYTDNAPSGSFVSDVLKILSGAGVSPDVQEAIIQQYVNSLPASSIYRSLVRRGNVAGFVGDTLTALETKTKSMAAQSAKIESVADIANKKREIEDRYNEIAKDDSLDTAKAQVIRDVAIQKHARFAISGAINKPMEVLYKELNQMAFLYTLGFNVSSAVVNLSQIPLVAVPYLSARYGLSNTIDAFTQAGSVIGGAKISLIEYYDDNYNLKSSVKKDIEQNSIDKKDAKARIEYLESIIPMVKEAHAQGKLYSSRTLVELGLGEKANARDKLAHLSAFFFNGGERFNTQTTILASYDLIRNKMFEDRKAGKKYFSVRQGKEIDVPTDVVQLRDIAAKEAIYTTQEVNGGARLETTAPIAKEGVGRVALMYKSYGLMMNSSMIKSGLAATNQLYKDNPEQRKIAIKQLAGIHLSALLFAGLGGVPIWGLISMVWDLYLDDEEDDADTILRKHISEMGFKGPLSTLTGVDVSSRIKLNDLIFQENRFMRDPSLEENIGYYLGGPALSTGKRLMRSIKDFSEAEYYRAAESAAPAGLGNVLQAGRYFRDNGVKTRGGQFIYENIGAGEIASKAFGFAPLEYSFRTAQSAAESKISNAVTKRRSKLNKLYFRALQDRDLSTARDVYEDIKEFNKRHPTAAISEDTIRRSIKSQLDKIATMHNGVPVNQMMQLALEKSRLEYKQWDK
jgi:hypothetical protein